MAGTTRRNVRHHAAPDRPAAIEQGRGGGGAVRRDPLGRPLVGRAGACEGVRQGGPTTATVRPGQYRRRGAEGRLRRRRPARRSEEGRVGKEGVSKCRSRWWR